MHKKGERNGNHSNILSWRIPWTEEPWATVHQVTRSRTQLVTEHTCTCIKSQDWLQHFASLLLLFPFKGL